MPNVQHSPVGRGGTRGREGLSMDVDILEESIRPSTREDGSLGPVGTSTPDHSPSTQGAGFLEESLYKRNRGADSRIKNVGSVRSASRDRVEKRLGVASNQKIWEAIQAISVALECQAIDPEDRERAQEGLKTLWDSINDSLQARKQGDSARPTSEVGPG